MADPAVDAAVALIGALAQSSTVPHQTLRGGKVTAYDATSNRAFVLIDGDDEATPMSVWGNVTPVVNRRCWVSFNKPRGLFLSALQ